MDKCGNMVPYFTATCLEEEEVWNGVATVMTCRQIRSEEDRSLTYHYSMQSEPNAVEANDSKVKWLPAITKAAFQDG
ncbi:hypothetical protein TcWFU_004579 [Taenia crassiceps]|uniref:Uncharacterized protein n=1 Tax=Taenia crassiceps TaxID=6207 RepID=A0ABR4Q760_9CEST